MKAIIQKLSSECSKLISMSILKFNSHIMILRSIYSMEFRRKLTSCRPWIVAFDFDFFSVGFFLILMWSFYDQRFCFRLNSQVHTFEISSKNALIVLNSRPLNWITRNLHLIISRFKLSKTKKKERFIAFYLNEKIKELLKIIENNWKLIKNELVLETILTSNKPLH